MVQHDQFAARIWKGDKLAIAALQNMTPEDVHGIERAIFGKYGFKIDLNTSPVEIRSALDKARAQAGSTGEQTTRLDRTLREANAEDS